jgi:hypothetical protein
MVFFFIADLALSFALKATTWCLGKTYDGISYLISRRTKASDNDDDDEFVVISLEDYRALRRKRGTINVKMKELAARTPSPTQEESVSVPDVVASSSK